MPRGVGNAFQTLEPNTAYSYLVNEHYSPDAAYPSVNPADETLAIDWPIPLEQAELSAKDRAQGPLSEVKPIAPRKTLVLGAGGQLGQALRAAYGDAPHVEFAERADFDLAGGDLEFRTPVAGLRHDHQCRGLHRRRRRPRPRKDALRRGPPTSPVLPRWRGSPPNTA